MRRNQYGMNPYQTSGRNTVPNLNTVYQQPYDPNETARYADILDKSQDRYDKARSNVSEFQGAVGGLETQDPELLNEHLDTFSSGINKMIEEEYGGDWGRARNVIADKIQEEKSNPLYNLIKQQNEQSKIHDQMRLKGGEDFLSTNDPRGAGALRAALQATNTPYSQRGEGFVSPDDYLLAGGLNRNYDKSAEELIKAVPANASQYYSSLDKNTADLFAQAIGSEEGVDGFLEKRGYSGNSLKLAKDQMQASLAESFYQQNKQALEAEFPGQEMKQAMNVIGNKIDQLSYGKTTSSITNYAPTVETEEGGDPPSSYDYTPIARNKFMDEEAQSKYKDQFKFLNKYKVDLNNPKLHPKMEGNSNIKNKAINAAFWAEENLAESSKNIENFKEYIPTFNKIYDNLGLEVPDWMNTAAKYAGTTGSLLGIKAQMADLTAKGASSAASGVGKAYGSLAKYMSGAGGVEDAYTVIDEYEAINGAIDSKDFNEKFEIAAQSMMNGTMVENKVLSLPSGRNENEGGKLKYNSASATNKLKTGAGVYDNSLKIYENGKLVDVSPEKLKDKLDLPKDIGYQDFDVVSFDPKTGNLIAETADSNGKRYSYQITDSQLRKDTKQVRQSFSDIRDNGYTAQNLGNGIYLIGYNELRTNPVDQSKMSVPVLRQVSSEDIGGKISLESIKENFKSGNGSKIFPLEDYSRELLRGLNSN